MLYALDQDGRVDTDGIMVDVAEGTVRLSGAVSSHEERQAAEEAAWTTEGVVDVINELVLSPSRKRSDQEIAADVRSALDKDAQLSNAGHIRVRSTGATVRLDGTVESISEREAAEKDAWYTAGVVYVENMLTVERRRESPSAA